MSNRWAARPSGSPIRTPPRAAAAGAASRCDRRATLERPALFRQPFDEASLAAGAVAAGHEQDDLAARADDRDRVAGAAGAGPVRGLAAHDQVTGIGSVAKHAEEPALHGGR